MTKKQTKGRRAALDRKSVLRAAIQLADQSGIESLSMRSMCKTIGVEAMSLYNHVASKAEILNGIVELVVEEIEFPTDSETVGWREAMRQRALSARQVFNDHPWAIGIMESLEAPGPILMQYYDKVIGCFRKAGFSIAMAAHAFSLLDNYIYGFVLQEQKLPFNSSAELADVADNILEGVAANEYPYFNEMITEHALKPGYEYAHEFEFGLDLILDGLATCLDQER